ncbi:MaoC family dehydratase N-terminal domain-containing protein [Chloroflexota bacterium]
MAQESLITEEMRSLIGSETEPYTMEVEMGAIRMYADAIGDLNPLYRDEEYARKSKYGAIIAPPTFLCTFDPYHHGQTKPCDAFPKRKGRASAGDRFEYYLPVKVGDVISSRVKLVDVYERDGGSGKLLFSVHERTFTNQHGELVARIWWTRAHF